MVCGFVSSRDSKRSMLVLAEMKLRISSYFSNLATAFSLNFNNRLLPQSSVKWHNVLIKLALIVSVSEISSSRPLTSS